jgi:hypothetical protein
MFCCGRTKGAARKAISALCSILSSLGYSTAGVRCRQLELLLKRYRQLRPSVRRAIRHPCTLPLLRLLLPHTLSVARAANLAASTLRALLLCLPTDLLTSVPPLVEPPVSLQTITALLLTLWFGFFRSGELLFTSPDATPLPSRSSATHSPDHSTLHLLASKTDLLHAGCDVHVPKIGGKGALSQPFSPRCVLPGFPTQAPPCSKMFPVVPSPIPSFHRSFRIWRSLRVSPASTLPPTGVTALRTCARSPPPIIYLPSRPLPHPSHVPSSPNHQLQQPPIIATHAISSTLASPHQCGKLFFLHFYRLQRHLAYLLPGTPATSQSQHGRCYSLVRCSTTIEQGYAFSRLLGLHTSESSICQMALQS